MIEHIDLFVIEQMGGTERLFWTCSTEHGCGWQPKGPKQSFSKSELVGQLRKMIEEKWFPGRVIIRQLSMPKDDCTHSE